MLVGVVTEFDVLWQVAPSVATLVEGPFGAIAGFLK